MPSTYAIMTTDVRESNRLRNQYWIHSGATMVPVTSRHLGRALRGLRGPVYYTDGAMDALVTDAHQEGPTWRTWQELRPRHTVLPFTAWVHLHESSVEELVQRGIPGAAMLETQYTIRQTPAAAFSAGPVQLVKLRARAAAVIRDVANRKLIRIAPDRIIVQDAQLDDGDTLVSASWSALPAAARKVPAWIVNGLDIESRA